MIKATRKRYRIYATLDDMEKLLEKLARLQPARTDLRQTSPAINYYTYPAGATLSCDTKHRVEVSISLYPLSTSIPRKSLWITVISTDVRMAGSICWEVDPANEDVEDEWKVEFIYLSPDKAEVQIYQSASHDKYPRLLSTGSAIFVYHDKGISDKIKKIETTVASIALKQHTP